VIKAGAEAPGVKAAKRRIELYIHGKRMAMVTKKDVPTIKNKMMNVAVVFVAQ